MCRFLKYAFALLLLVDPATAASRGLARDAEVATVGAVSLPSPAEQQQQPREYQQHQQQRRPLIRRMPAQMRNMMTSGLMIRAPIFFLAGLGLNAPQLLSSAVWEQASSVMNVKDTLTALLCIWIFLKVSLREQEVQDADWNYQADGGAGDGGNQHVFIP